MTNFDSIVALLPDYEVGRELGRGQFGIVYAGRHRQLSRDVAIKLLAGPLAGNDEYGARFRREARILAALDHGHVVSVFDYREEGDVRLLVLELLTGGTLADRQLGGMAPESLVAATLAAACGLHHVHQQGVLHRDVKPENLMFDSRGTLKVTDFGIARGDIAAATHVNLTQAGELFGTPAYIAPEQAAEALSSGWPPVGQAADQYALGALLFEGLSGQLTHLSEGGTIALCMARINSEARSLHDIAPQVPPPIADVVMRSIARDPAQRYPSTEDFGVDLGQAAAQAYGPGWLDRSEVQIREAGAIRTAAETSPHPTAVVTRAPSQPPPPTRSHRRWPMLVGGVVALALVVTLVLFLTAGRDNPSPTAGPASSTVVAADLPLTITPEWTFPTQENVFASPAINENLVVVGSEDNSVYGLDLQTGAQRWKATTGDKVRSSAAIDGGSAFVGSNDGNVYSFSTADGAQQWSHPVGYQIVSSPAVANGLVFIGADKLYALDQSTGQQRWVFDGATDVIVSSPAVSDGLVVFGSNDGYVYGVNAADGTAAFKVLTGGKVQSSPRVADGTIYLGSDDGDLYSIDLATHHINWHSPAGGGPIKSSPAVGPDAVYIGTETGSVVAFSRADGKVLWNRPTGDNVDSSPALVPGLVVAGSNDGRVYFLDSATGEVKGAFETKGAVLSSPRASANLVVVGSQDDTVYALTGFGSA